MKEKLAALSLTKPNLAFSIFCGNLHYSESLLDSLLSDKNLVKWQPHLSKPESDDYKLKNQPVTDLRGFFDDLKGFYYPGFISSLLPGVAASNSTLAQSYSLPGGNLQISDNKSIKTDYLDLFFFPGNILIYCFKCDLSDRTIEEILEINNIIREVDIWKLTYIASHLETFSMDKVLNEGNKLKLFTVIEDNFLFDNNYTSDHLLYDLGTCSPLGSSVGSGSKPLLKPSTEYFEALLRNHKISVFENWSALTLFDTFTLLHRGEVYTYNWECIYFRMLYIHSLFVKCYLVKISKEFLMGTNLKSLENEFYEFNKHFNLKQISFNFLPQLVYEKIREGLSLENELVKITQAIDRDHRLRIERRQEEEARSEKKINLALFIVTMLTLFTAVRDGSEWLMQVFSVEYGHLFNILTITVFLIVYSAIFYLLTRKK